MILMTNDDGIDAPGFELLVKAMNKAGIPLVAFAPSGNKSACSMQLNLQTHRLHNRNELIQQWDLDESVACIFALDGTPCDTMIVALDGGLNHVLPDIQPSLVLSGVNLGPNPSQDSYHSGTMGAAREAGLYVFLPLQAPTHRSILKAWRSGSKRLSNLFNGFFLSYQRHQKTSVVLTLTYTLNMFLLGQIRHLSAHPHKRISN